VILKTSGGIGSFLVAHRLFDHEALRIGTSKNSSENALILWWCARVRTFVQFASFVTIRDLLVLILCLRRCSLRSQSRINEWHESSKSAEICCSQIDTTQAVKVTGFNHRGHREHRVFKPILRVPLCPLWLYCLLMSFMSVAVLCIQLTITKSAEITGFLDSVLHIIKTAGVKP
jgi:hypothetical protein